MIEGTWQPNAQTSVDKEYDQWVTDAAETGYSIADNYLEHYEFQKAEDRIDPDNFFVEAAQPTALSEVINGKNAKREFTVRELVIAHRALIERIRDHEEESDRLAEDRNALIKAIHQIPPQGGPAVTAAMELANKLNDGGHVKEGK